MPAPKGNEFWKARSTHGRKPIFATADDLWAGAVEYYEWVEANPLYEANLAFATGTDIDADGVLAITGTITLLHEKWGDNVNGPAAAGVDYVLLTGR
jgi:hypothetical protein